MVREVTYTAEVTGLDPEAAFKLLYLDSHFLKRYHEEVNKDPDAKIQPWDGNNTRLVTYSTPLNAPGFVTRLVGSETLYIRETQRWSRTEQGHYRIDVEPRLQLEGGDKFKTTCSMELRPAKSPKCTEMVVTAKLECASKVWGAQAVMEGFMADQSKKSFRNWMRMVHTVCGEAAVGTMRVEEDTSSEEYFDPEGELETGTDLFPSDSELTLEWWFVQSVLRDMNSLKITAEASKSMLSRMEARLQRLEKKLEARQLTKWFGSDTSWYARGWQLGTAGLVTAAVVVAANAYVRTHRFG